MLVQSARLDQLYSLTVHCFRPLTVAVEFNRLTKRNGSRIVEREWVVAFDDVEAVAQLRSALFFADQADRRTDRLLVFIVDRFAGLNVEVFAREHPPPHFRVCVGNNVANYRIEDCVHLNGDLLFHYRIIRKWHAKNKEKLVDEWNRLRPSDCPVGEYREV